MSERFTVKLTPKASRTEIKGWADGADGQRILKASVTAVPEKGKANEALIKLLAEYTGLSKGSFTIVRGEADRVKVIEITGFSGPAASLFSGFKN